VSHESFWYEVVDGSTLRQGDIVRGLVVPALDESIGHRLDEIARQEGETELVLPLVYTRADWIVLDASCDVDYGPKRSPALSHVLIARVVPADGEGLGTQVLKELAERQEMLRQSIAYNKFLLSTYGDIDPPFPLSYAEYRFRYAVPHAYLVAFVTACGPRLRLRHPIRERFGNWVGAAISRVGVEDAATIPRFASLQGSKPLKAVDGVEPERGG